MKINYEKLPDMKHETRNACNDVPVLIKFSLRDIIIFLQSSFLINIFFAK